MIHYGVIGLGPVGSTLAACLRQAGHRVSVLCGYSDKFKCLRDSAILVSGSGLGANARMSDVFLDSKEFILATPEIILIATKSCDSGPLLKALKLANPRPNTIFVSCQNGLDVEDAIAREFGQDKTLRMVLNMGGRLVRENEVQVGFCYTHYLSLRPEVDRSINEQIAIDLTKAGLKTELREDYRQEVFKKVILNSSLGTMCALTRLTMKSVMDDPGLKETVKHMVSEGLAVAERTGLNLGPDFMSYAMTYLSKGGDHKPSMLMDIEAKRKTENEDHCGKILELAKRSGVQTPVTETVYNLMKTLERSGICQ